MEATVTNRASGEKRWGQMSGERRSQGEGDEWGVMQGGPERWWIK